MAPKLLTDCPENLREAIDWLVQVRHCGGVSTLSSALSTLFDNVAQDAEKSLPSLPDPDRPSARDVVSKLRAFQSTLPKDSANPHKNIIHNLCTSAGSLLGYRSPGTYDGSGIVYGNASRLCDAILAFLYAVFCDVHDNQPYVAGRSALHDDVILQLKSQLWRGHKGFCQVIPKVASGLHRYNAAVTASNERVKKPIETVLEYVKSDGELCNGIKALQVGDVTGDPDVEDPKVSKAVSLVEGCKEVARAFSKSLTAAKEAIDDLHPKLKRKLENARKSFFNHVDWLSRWSKKGEKQKLDKMVQKINTRLRQLGKAVKDKIKQEVHTVVELLKKRVREIKMKLEGITASLGDYVKELGQWMGDAKEYIKDVKKYVNDIMQQLDGKHRQAIDKAAADIDSELGKKVGELATWIEDAEAAVTVAKQKADEVHKRLDKDDKDQKISQGIEKITKAKDAVSGVSTQLQTVHKDLENWKSVALDVLSTAFQKAQHVHDKLNPDQSGEDYPIGANIKNINDAKNEIDKANTALGKQVENLHKWIETAENIRQKAEEKAKEAYDKLDVHEALSQNVQKIVEAKEKIEAVNKNVTVQLGSLNQWNDKARSVLDGAVQKAEEVWKGLNANVGNHVVKIEENNNLIKNASESLENQVNHLGKWKDVANEVIDKAGKKCDEILKKVKTSKDGTIFTEASKLKEQGTKLLTAATEAKHTVEQKVKDALEAVKAMDSDLKRDLKEVKEKINEGIKDVIEKLKVSDLGKEVKKDLQKLRGNIDGLGKTGNVNSLVGEQLKAVEQAKTATIDEVQRKLKEAASAMDAKFKSEIKEPLSTEVEKVTTAIKDLYEKINPKNGRSTEEDKRKLHKIFEHIKGKVADIKGNAGSGTQNNGAKGLDGIIFKTKVLAQQFNSASQFGHKVNGFVMEILKENRIVREMLEKYANEKGLKDDYIQPQRGKENSSFYTRIADIFKDNLKIEGDAAGQKAEGLYSEAQSNPTIKGYITAVKEGLTTFVDKVEEKLKVTDMEDVEDKIDELVGKISPSIVSDVKSKGQPSQATNSEDLKLVVKRILMKLIVIVRKVAKEVKYLGIDVFGAMLDSIKPTVDGLNTNLTNATKTGTRDPGTAQAVDKAIEKVREEVDKEITKKFESDVKKPVEEAAQGLENAVTEYDKLAKEQVKEAAKGAIDQAAKQISKNENVELSEAMSKMPNFSEAHQKINNELKNELEKKVNTAMGYDGWTSTVEVENALRNYRSHINRANSRNTNGPNGKLPAAIEEIGTKGLQALNKHIGNGGSAAIQETNFTDPFEKIQQEIKEIEKLVSQNGGSSRDDGGVKNLLEDLRTALGSGTLDGAFEKGLKNILSAIGGLQKGTLVPKPDAIDKAVKEIKLKLNELKKKLKSDSDSDKSPVINALNDLKETGLSSETWNSTAGLAQVHKDLEQQNEKLAEQNKIIGKAFDYTIKELKGMLGQVGLRLHNSIVPDDVVDNLRKLKLEIGRNKKVGLEGIYEFIKTLQERNFTHKPQDIGKAKDEIAEELKKLQSGLQGDTNNGVIETLKDLMKAGLGSDDWVKGENKKGLQKIEKELMGQQESLAQQPEKITTSVNLITKELQELREELQGNDSGKAGEKGVIHNLQDMLTMIGKDENKGLKNIKTEIESLRNSQVPKVIGNLNSMSLNITNAAAQLGLNLNQLDNPHIDGKLKGIQGGLDNLRLTDVAEAIRLCDDFLIKADEIERNTIDALLKHVDHEVDDVIKDLTKEARELYVESVREALEMLARKVEGDLEQLPGDINNDLTIGYKGFMNTVEGENSENINKLKCVESKELSLLSAEFAGFFGTVNDYVRKEITRLHDEQNKEKNLSLPPTDEPYTPKLNDVYVALTALLVYLRDNDDGADKLTELVETLTTSLGNLAPSDFKHPSTPLLDTVARGLSKFAGEFGNTYISAYSGQRFREEHAHKYAKVLLSVIPMTHKALTKLATKCESEWKSLHICEFTSDHKDNALGNYLTRCGYRVSTSESEQDGELNNMFTGAGIHELLTTPIPDVAVKMHLDGELVTDGINMYHITSLLYNVLCHYFQVCHLYVHPEPRYPCMVRDMLSWLSGLQYTQVADKLSGHCKALLNRQCHDGDTPNRDDPVMAECIGELPHTIATTCLHSTALLTAIQGNGHGFDLAAYPYSVDFSNNRAKLHYPADPDALLDMLREIVCRLCRVLYFLYSQCCRSTARVKGWRECAYGRQVQSHRWQCNTFNVQSAASATTAATTTSTTTTITGCPPTSPLQSFLSDSCHGLLPHTLTAADMVIECANCTANQPGQQCLTPLGFWDLGFAASISGTGWHLAKRLGDMCRDADSCLFVLCRTLFLLCPTAPSSLADVFALYAQVLRKWDPHDRVRNRGGTYTDASDFISHLNTDGIGSLFPMWTQLHGNYENGKLTTAIASLTDHDHESHNGLSTLFYDSTCKPPSNCAPYLQPLGLHAHHTYPQKHAGLYITWIMYLAWQFWELLCGLLQALDNINCTASGCATCPCQPGIHGDKDTCHCPSLVQCAGPLPTLYRYGFTYRNANLLVTNNYATRCSDLNTQLKEALHSAHFTELFRQIDQLIWHIRMPFLHFLIALWSLVALYILHTFLYRLDIFHIRSHLLTTKASHRIDVKALLIPSRKMLSLYNASYFDDDPNELLNLK